MCAGGYSGPRGLARRDGGKDMTPTLHSTRLGRVAPLNLEVTFAFKGGQPPRPSLSSRKAANLLHVIHLRLPRFHQFLTWFGTVTAMPLGASQMHSVGTSTIPVSNVSHDQAQRFFNSTVTIDGGWRMGWRHRFCWRHGRDGSNRHRQGQYQAWPRHLSNELAG